MDPQLREIPSRSVRLRLFIFVVREAQIDATTVNIKGFTQVAVGHRRAFEVPTWTSPPPGRIPRCGYGFLWLRSFPQGKVTRILLPGLGRGINLRFIFGRTHVFEALVSQRAIVLLRGHREVDVSCAVAVGVAAIHQTLDQSNLLWDMPGRTRFIGGVKHTELVISLSKFALIALSPCPPRHAGFCRLTKDLVINIRDITDVGHLKTAALKPANQGIESDRRTQMSNVRRTLNGCTTQVNSHMSGHHWIQWLQACGFRIVQVKAHTFMVKGATFIWRPVRPPGPCNGEISALA